MFNREVKITFSQLVKSISAFFNIQHVSVNFVYSLNGLRNRFFSLSLSFGPFVSQRDS